MKTETESNIQQQIYIWFNNTFCLKNHNPRSIIFAVPNGGTRNAREALTLKLTGLLPGVSDLIVIHNGKVIFVEVKLPSNKQQSVQIDFQKRITEQGLNYHIVHSLEEFKSITNPNTDEAF